MYPDQRMVADAGSPETRIVIERPPPGLARGKVAWPAWAIGTVGGVVAALGLGYMVWRWRRLRRSQ